MSTNKPPRKKTVVVTKKGDSGSGKEKLKPTTQRSKSSSSPSKGLDLLYGWSQYMLMLGGSMPSPDVWDDSIIYSFRRITLAPIFIVAGLLVQIYAIFKD